MSEQELMPPPIDTPDSNSDSGLITGVPDFIEPASPEPVWEYTQKAKEDHGEQFQGREIIGRDTPIDGGVYTGRYGGEAIVVDSQKYPDGFNKLMEQVARQIYDEDGFVDKSRVLGAVFGVVSENMRYSKEGVDSILKDIADRQGLEKFKDGTKVSLDSFITEGVGVCRHQALTVGLLLESLKKDGVISGNVSVDRNMNWNPNNDKYDGHAWVRYTNSAGRVYILDVAQGYFGRIEDSEGDRHGWDYLRPEEKRRRQ